MGMGTSGAGIIGAGNIPDYSISVQKFLNGASGGELIVYGATGSASHLGANTAGKFLMTNGIGVAPSWETVASGGSLVFVETKSASGTVTTLDFDATLDSSLVNRYIVIIEPFSTVTGGSEINLRLNGATDTGTSERLQHYGASVNSATLASKTQVANAVGSADVNYSEFIIDAPGSATRKYFKSYAINNQSGTLVVQDTFALTSTTATITSIGVMSVTASRIPSGFTMHLYKVVNS